MTYDLNAYGSQVRYEESLPAPKFYNPWGLTENEAAADYETVTEQARVAVDYGFTGLPSTKAM